MGEAVMDLVTLGIYGIVGLSVVGFVIWRVVKMQQAAQAPISDEECVACGSRQLTTLTEGTYRCDGCGYEGGSGMAEARAGEERTRIEALSPEERHHAGLRDLRGALSDLAAARELLSGAAPGTAELDSARRSVLEAEESIRLAGLELGAPLLAEASGASDVSHLATATVADAIGGVATLATSAVEASSLHQKATHLSHVAESALARFAA